MKNSIRAKLTFFLTSLILFVIVFTWVLNKGFLENFYIHNKMKEIDKTYMMVKEIYKNSEKKGLLSEDQSLELQRIASSKNVNIYIFEEYAIYVFNNYLSSSYDANEKDTQDIKQINSLIKEYWYSGSNPDVKDKKILKSKKDYSIYRLYDTKRQSKFIDLVDETRTIILRTNYEVMQESVEISNQFLAYIGVIAIIIGIIATWFIGRKFTRPILKLADIASKISDLNFENRYIIKNNDEIDQLGESINILSFRLENTISELKEANNELLIDIKNKNMMDEMRQEFLSNVSHELKTPISLIQGYAEGLRENIHDDAESREFYCDVIIDEANKMSQLVKKLLSLNQIEFGDMQIKIERFDIVDLIQSVLDSVKVLFQQKNIVLHFENSEPIYVWSDKYLIEDIMINYINNAINHVKDANIIEIKIIEHDDLVRVAVFNTGDNIPNEELEKIWDKFYKVDKARTREYGGTGIGLSIVKAIMKSLNNNYGVINRNIGVEFWFEVEKNI